MPGLIATGELPTLVFTVCRPGCCTVMTVVYSISPVSVFGKLLFIVVSTATFSPTRK